MIKKHLYSIDKKVIILAGVFLIMFVTSLFAVGSKSGAKQQAESASTTSIPTSTPSISLVPLTTPTTVVTTTTIPLNGDDATADDIKGQLQSASSPYDANTTNYLKTQSQNAVLAYLIGQGRTSFPSLWPDVASGSDGADANFKTAEIIGSQVASGDASSASLTVYWQSADLDSTNFPQSATVSAKNQNGTWQITNIQISN